MESPSLRPPIVELLLKGTEHWESVTTTLGTKDIKTPVTTEMMMAIKRKLFEASWSIQQKFLFWAVCCLLWNGSLRVHEALSRLQTTFDPQTTLLSNNIIPYYNLIY